jgi:hypothetical protein
MAFIFLMAQGRKWRVSPCTTDLAGLPKKAAPVPAGAIIPAVAPPKAVLAILRKALPADTDTKTFSL